MKKVLLSVVVVNHEGYKYVTKCVDSILRSNTKNLEIVIVDNGSNNDPIALSRRYKNYLGKKVIIVALERNHGPSRARNEGVKIAKGKYVGFLDNDTIVDKNWANEAIKKFEKNSTVGAIQCKLLLKKDKKSIDYVGEFIGQNGFLVQRAPVGEIDKGQYDQEVEILAAKSAGMFIRKDVFKKAGGFDPDYFIYVEETDLGWRTWLSGYKVVFVPPSIVYHEFGTSTIILGKNKNNYNAKFHGSKNYILTLLKNLDSSHLFTILPAHVFLWLGLAWFSLLRGQFRNFWWIHKGVAWNLIHYPSSWRKRRLVQQKRKITDERLFAKVMAKRNILYFIKKVIIKHQVGNAESF